MNRSERRHRTRRHVLRELKKARYGEVLWSMRPAGYRWVYAMERGRRLVPWFQSVEITDYRGNIYPWADKSDIKSVQKCTGFCKKGRVGSKYFYSDDEWVFAGKARQRKKMITGYLEQMAEIGYDTLVGNLPGRRRSWTKGSI